MKAISIKQPWADQIIFGNKKIEYRSWPTKYRGDVLICSSKKSEPGACASALTGHAIGIVEIADCKQFEEGEYQWTLANPRPIKPFPVKGKLSFFNVDFPGGDEGEEHF